MSILVVYIADTLADGSPAMSTIGFPWSLSQNPLVYQKSYSSDYKHVCSLHDFSTHCSTHQLFIKHLQYLALPVMVSKLPRGFLFFCFFFPSSPVPSTLFFDFEAAVLSMSLPCQQSALPAHTTSLPVSTFVTSVVNLPLMKMEANGSGCTLVSCHTPFSIRCPKHTSLTTIVTSNCTGTSQHNAQHLVATQTIHCRPPLSSC